MENLELIHLFLNFFTKLNLFLYTPKKHLTFVRCFWRRTRDSNPRTSFIQPTPLAGEPLRPLGYFSNRKFCRYAKSASTYYHIFFARSIILSVYFKFIFFFRNPYDFKSQSAGLVEVGGLYYFCFLRRL